MLDAESCPRVRQAPHVLQAPQVLAVPQVTQVPRVPQIAEVEQFPPAPQLPQVSQVPQAHTCRTYPMGVGGLAGPTGSSEPPVDTCAEPPAQAPQSPPWIRAQTPLCIDRSRELMSAMRLVKSNQLREGMHFHSKCAVNVQ